MKTKRTLVLLLSSIFFVSAALPAGADFRSLADRIERDYHLDRTWIPFLGLGRIVVRAAKPNGIHDIKLAVFEDDRAHLVNVSSIVREEIGSDWQPIVRARSHDEESVIFAKSDGDLMRLLIVARESDELVVLEVAMDPEKFVEEMRSPEQIAHNLD